MIDVIPNIKNGLWLDIGSGDGFFTTLLKQRKSTIDVLQIDLRRYSNLSKYGFLGDLRSVPLRSQSSTGIILGQVLHYLPNHTHIRILENLEYLIRPGGFIVVIEYEANRSYSWIPFPITVKNLRKMITQIHNLRETKCIRIKDGNRPKFSFVVQKKA